MSLQSILLNALNGFRIQDAHIESRPQGGGHIIDAFVAAFSQAGTRMHYIFRVINKRFFTKATLKNNCRIFYEPTAGLER